MVVIKNPKEDSGDATLAIQDTGSVAVSAGWHMWSNFEFRAPTK